MEYTRIGLLQFSSVPEHADGRTGRWGVTFNVTTVRSEPEPVVNRYLRCGSDGFG